MPICASSIPDALMALAMMALLAASPAPAWAQDNAQAAHATKPSPDAMNRLKEALAKRSPPDIPGPSKVPPLPPALQHRAFETLNRKQSAPAVEKRAQAAQQAAAKRLEAERDAMTARLYQALGIDPPKLVSAPAKSGSSDAIAGSPSAWVPVLFVSSSMPVTTLRTYARQLEQVRGILAFRGVPGGLAKIGPMARLSAEILRRDPGCEGPACVMRDVQLIVDPMLFRQHGVQVVPALAMVPGDPTQPYCERDEEAAPMAAHLVLGDAALEGMLEEYRRLGGDKEVRDAEARLSRR